MQYTAYHYSIYALLRKLFYYINLCDLCDLVVLKKGETFYFGISPTGTVDEAERL